MPQAAPQQQHAFKGFDDWIEVFKAGTHVDSKGTEATFTAADLDQLAANSVKFGPVPAVLGHPKHNDPAYAWGTLKREGDSLFAKFTDVHPGFEAGVKSGAYRNRSISVFKDPAHGWRPRHVGWLGAALPAIDGLKPVEFAADAADVHEFAAEVDPWTLAGALDDMAAGLRAVRDNLIATSGLEAADAAIPDWRITSLSSTAQRIRDDARDDGTALRPFSRSSTGADMPFSQEDLDRTAAETEARVRAELAASQSAEFTAAQQQLKQLKTQAQADRIKVQITGWKAAGMLLPAEEPGLAEFMATLEGEPESTAATFEFTAADKAATKKTAAQYFADFVAARGRLVKLGAVGDAAGDPGPNGGGQVLAFTAQPGYEGLAVDGDRAALDERIKKHMAEHKCDYAAAAAAVMVVSNTGKA